ncbi:hypothetical protein [Nocardioides sp.]|jgi:truncated hemoglobin YjbI|uniref:globin domain-containing protein n=1 Tax=Nocardioides sp. TaxID=35761 RepID=UPI001DAD6ACF|nr:hypothetical protein [Nocardioides sp.]MBU1803057.1 hypothetical protein [Actinomycetota bacterium]
MDQALYDHLGGRDAITTVVGGLYSRLLDDEEIAPAFAGIDLTRLRQVLATIGPLRNEFVHGAAV